METKRALQEVDPLCLPVGMRVGPWRVEGWRGRGAYGTVYRVKRDGREAEGEFALKLAIRPGDERFGREAQLLSRIDSPHVPRLREQGEWEHPGGVFPYLVMDWVAGEPLYQWAARRNPTVRQGLRVLAQVARALEATHAVGGVHRDVKGGNVLVRPGDGRAFLTDFGAGHYRGAATLTGKGKVLPPGTPAYRSPEAWDYLSLFVRHPTAHYAASACDDLFALGVMAHRLVTDEYPPPTQPEQSGSEVWRQGGPGPRPPRELNPRVSPELDALILRLLAPAPAERFGGRAREAAEALEQAAEREGAEGDARLFTWSKEHSLRQRSPRSVRLAGGQDAEARAEQARREVEERARTQAAREQAPPRALVPVWGAEMAVAFSGLLLAGLTVAWLYRGQEVAQAAAEWSSREGDSVALGDSATPARELASMLTEDRRKAVGLQMPEKPFPSQYKPPCNRSGEVEIRGGCWFRLGDAKPPCSENAYEWKKACYLPSEPSRRQPTAYPP